MDLNRHTEYPAQNQICKTHRQRVSLLNWDRSVQRPPASFSLYLLTVTTEISGAHLSNPSALV